MDNPAWLKDIKLFVLDMDGTFYLGENIIPGSLQFLDRVRETGRRALFFTNNSSRTPQLYIQKLAGMGCEITGKDIMTSGDVTIHYLKTYHPGQSVYLMGTQALCHNFLGEGIHLVEDEQPQVVVAAFDMELTYHKLERACTYIRNGATFLATHLDVNCPTADGFIPDCGAFCAAISLSTGVQPKYLGKPFRETADMVRVASGLPLEQIAFAGDRLYTDVATGVNNGARGILVLSGETKLEDIPKSEVKPDAVYENLLELGHRL